MFESLRQAYIDKGTEGLDAQLKYAFTVMLPARGSLSQTCGTRPSLLICGILSNGIRRPGQYSGRYIFMWDLRILAKHTML
jgi:hypothetical protein